MNGVGVLSALRRQSTWSLFFLSTITLGIYAGHYIKRQTRSVNKAFQNEYQIPERGLASTILILSYLTALLLIPAILLEYYGQTTLLQLFSDLLDVIWGILVIIWAFMMRSRMNFLLFDGDRNDFWFSGVWTLLFSLFYINYKINKILAVLPPPLSPTVLASQSAGAQLDRLEQLAAYYELGLLSDEEFQAEKAKSI